MKLKQPQLPRKCRECTVIHEIFQKPPEAPPQEFKEMRASELMPELVVGGRSMRRVMETIWRIRRSNVPVLITGETGTGKELVARALHFESQRWKNPLIPVNTHAITPSLFESTLFGHRKGSFTGAHRDSEGLARAADGGTLFFDEIGDLQTSVQAKLLRFLQEGEILPVGETKPVRVDVRMVAATNRRIEKEIEAGQFRMDLFYRLAGIQIEMLPLRERRDEIPGLIDHFWRISCAKEMKAPRLSGRARKLLLSYDYPGNIRELANEVRRLVALASARERVPAESLSPRLLDQANGHGPNLAAGSFKVPKGLKHYEAVNELERQMIRSALDRRSNNLTRAARDLGLTRKGLRSKIRRLSLEPSL